MKVPDHTSNEIAIETDLGKVHLAIMRVQVPRGFPAGSGVQFGCRERMRGRRADGAAFRMGLSTFRCHGFEMATARTSYGMG